MANIWFGWLCNREALVYSTLGNTVYHTGKGFKAASEGPSAEENGAKANGGMQDHNKQKWF